MNSVFSGSTADSVWWQAMLAIHNLQQVAQDSRMGNTQEILHTSFRITTPRQRWVYSRKPAINPAFAIAEVFWILSGKNNSKFINFWNPLLPKFAGEGNKYHGAYGFRIRKNFTVDQLTQAYHALKNNPTTRQVVIQIWDPKKDIPNADGSPANHDIPCNICSILKIRDNKLEWLQIMRSNDLYRGTPYNFIQFTTLQEILAGWLNVDVGEYHQVSDSLHIYESDKNEIVLKNQAAHISNNDTLSTTKDRADTLIPSLYADLNKLTTRNLTPKALRNIAFADSYEQGYKNMLLIAAADSARRRHWNHEIDEIIDRCTNPALVYCWTEWKKRRDHETTRTPQNI